jgi:hypothetical protein
MSRINDTRAQYQPPPKAEKPGHGKALTRDTLRRHESEVYLAAKGLYLSQNLQCTRPGCMKQATEIHHIVSGTAGKAVSRLNSDTWLGVCGSDCHEFIERLPWELQKMLKALRVQETIDRLRT